MKLKPAFPIEIAQSRGGHLMLIQADIPYDEDQKILISAHQLPVLIAELQRAYETRHEWWSDVEEEDTEDDEPSEPAKGGGG